MEPEGSLPRSQAPTTCPYPELDRSNPHSHNPLSEDSSYYYPPICAWVSQVVYSFRFSHHNPVHASFLPHTLYMPAHLILLDFITRTMKKMYIRGKYEDNRWGNNVTVRTRRLLLDFFWCFAERTSQYIYLSNLPTWCTKFCFTISLFHASTCFEHHVLETCRGMK